MPAEVEEKAPENRVSLESYVREGPAVLWQVESSLDAVLEGLKRGLQGD